jgi:hypothetical protein
MLVKHATERTYNNQIDISAQVSGCRQTTAGDKVSLGRRLQVMMKRLIVDPVAGEEGQHDMQDAGRWMQGGGCRGWMPDVGGRGQGTINLTMGMMQDAVGSL